MLAFYLREGQNLVMSIEIVGRNPSDEEVIGEIGVLAADLCRAQSEDTTGSYTTSVRAGEFAGEVIFASLRQLGIIPKEGFDVTAFLVTAKAIKDASISSIPTSS